MKKLLLSMATMATVAFSAQATVTVEDLDRMRVDCSPLSGVAQAKCYWNNRTSSTSGLEQTRKAVELYGRLAESETDVMAKADHYLRQSESIYFVGDMVETKAEKIKLHLQGAEFASKGQAFLTANHEETSRKMAELIYYEAANRGRWAEANGILNSLQEWPNIRKKLEQVIEMGHKDVFDYGANRILGRAYFKLPFPLGSKEKSKNYLSEAFDETLHSSMNVSTNGVTIYFYAEVLADTGEKDKAKEMLQEFVQVGESMESLKSYNADRMPETAILDIKEAKKILQRL